MNNSYYKVNRINSETLIISFAGNTKLYGGLGKAP